MTTTATPAKTASDSAARPFATVNPFTGERVREFPFLDTSQVLNARELSSRRPY
jgi:succinate-semialdehyde dehydrogenase / glutarate-semialdehyde dehydrogenase